MKGDVFANAVPGRCKASLFKRWNFYQCQRKDSIDGWCKQHHPGAIAARDKARQERWDGEAEAREQARVARVNAIKREALEKAERIALDMCGRCIAEPCTACRIASEIRRELIEAFKTA